MSSLIPGEIAPSVLLSFFLSSVPKSHVPFYDTWRVCFELLKKSSYCMNAGSLEEYKNGILAANAVAAAAVSYSPFVSLTLRNPVVSKRPSVHEETA